MGADQIVTLITGGAGGLAVAVIFLVLFTSGKIHSDAEFAREVERGDREAEARQRLEEALLARGSALAEANARADAAVRSSELIASALLGREGSGDGSPHTRIGRADR